MNNAVSENTEIEWTFQGSEGLFEKIRKIIQQSGFVIDREAEDKLISTYYDTPSLAVRKMAKFVLRVRDFGNGTFIQTVKGKSIPTDDPAISSRLEYEVELPSKEPNLNVIKDEDIAARFVGFEDEDLKPLFVTDYMRRHFHAQLNDQDQTVLQFCYDKGTVYLSDDSTVKQEIDEIEIEFVSGSLENSVKFVTYLRQKLGAEIVDQPMGKGRRALNLYDGYIKSV